MDLLRYTETFACANRRTAVRLVSAVQIQYNTRKIKKHTTKGMFFILTGCGVMSLTSYRAALLRDKRHLLYSILSKCQIFYCLVLSCYMS